MQLTSFNYVKATETDAGSLARVATLIRAARDDAQARNETCLLIDNGDTWQGNPLADHLASEKHLEPHPMAQAMTLLGYDAIGMGNHDFDFGADYLSACLAQTSAPAICSNMKSAAMPDIADSVILDRQGLTNEGHRETIRIGILSTAPDLTNIWNRHHLTGKLWFSPALPALRAGAQRLRAQGADVVIALAHMGFAIFDEGLHPQNELEAVAALPDIDAVVGGHTHQRFPTKPSCQTECPKAAMGLIDATPVVQPGSSGSDLGQIRLTLTKAHVTDPWQISGASSNLIPVQPNTQEDPDIVRLTQRVHDATCSFLEKPAARLAKPMNTYFALAQPSPVQGLLAAAKRKMIKKAVSGTELADLPLLAVASATLTGGLDGPENFISLKGGEIKHRHIAGMNPYANQVWAVRTTGARLLDWLERSAVIFNTLVADTPNQLLINPNIPGFRYDAIFGLSYEIDPRQKPRFNEAGHRIPNRGGRVSAVTWQGQPLDPNQEFLVATTDHRAGGGGIYQPFANDDILLRGYAPLKTALLDYLENPSCDEVRSVKPWRLKPGLSVSAILLSAPDAANHFDEISGFTPEDCGLTDDGFLQVRLSL